MAKSGCMTRRNWRRRRWMPGQRWCGWWRRGFEEIAFEVFCRGEFIRQGLRSNPPHFRMAAPADRLVNEFAPTTDVLAFASGIGHGMRLGPYHLRRQRLT